jgi:hypothetical protein
LKSGSLPCDQSLIQRRRQLQAKIFNGVFAAMLHGTYGFLACAALMLLANSPNKDLMHLAKLNLKSLRI